MTRRVLLINPNTSTWVTDALVAQIESVLGDASDIELTAATATLGASYIACEVSYALAAHALLDSFAAHYDGHDAVIVGCFGDPGTAALALVSPVPVIGMAEAAMREASAMGRFAIVTGGAAWQPMLQRLALATGFGSRLAHIETVTRSAAELARDRPAALALLARACANAMSHGSDSIILGGAAFAGYGDELARITNLPVIDSVSAMARAVRNHVQDPAVARSPGPSAGFARSAAVYSGIAEPLARLLNAAPPPRDPAA